MLTKVLSIELKQDDILAVTFCPGWVQTDMGGPSAHLTAEQVRKIKLFNYFFRETVYEMKLC